MGKCVRIHRSSKHPSPSPAGDAAAYLTLRSGRRVPVSAAAACSSPPGSRHRRGSSACRRRCGASSKHACGSPGRHKSAGVLGAQLTGGGGRPEVEQTPPSSSQASLVAGDVDGGGRRDDNSRLLNTPLAGDVVRANDEHGRKSGVVAGQRSPVLEAEMEAFFAAAELAERRRFAAAYNYDVALDRPLEGRYEWAPVNT